MATTVSAVGTYGTSTIKAEISGVSGLAKDYIVVIFSTNNGSVANAGSFVPSSGDTGNAPTLLRLGTIVASGEPAGLRLSMYGGRAENSFSSTTFTADWASSGAATWRAAMIRIRPDSGINLSMLGTVATGTQINSLTTTVNPRVGDVVVGAMWNTATDLDADTINGSWSSGGSTYGPGSTSYYLVYQYKICTGSGSQTYNLGGTYSAMALLGVGASELPYWGILAG